MKNLQGMVLEARHGGRHALRNLSDFKLVILHIISVLCLVIAMTVTSNEDLPGDKDASLKTLVLPTRLISLLILPC